jgi:cell division inhibitor SulA
MQQLAFGTIETARDFGFKPSAYRELAVDNRPMELDSNVLPILSKLSRRHDQRWLTCVNTPLLAKDVARAAGIQQNKLLRVHSSEKLGPAEVIMKALRSGRSHTVIGFCKDLTVAQREQLRQCAELADCQCLLLSRGN